MKRQAGRMTDEQGEISWEKSIDTRNIAQNRRVNGEANLEVSLESTEISCCVLWE